MSVSYVTLHITAIFIFKTVLCLDCYNLSVVHFNDFHARYEPVTNLSTPCLGDTCIGGFSRLYSAIMALIRDRPNTVLVNAGDNFKGTLWYNVHKWNVTQYFLNKLPLDAITLGNHEFDDDIPGLIPFLKSVHAPVVVANIDDNQEPTMQHLYNKSIILEKGGKKIGVIGIISATTQMVSHTGKLIFKNESISIEDEAKKLEKHGVFTNIVLSHCGYDVDIQIAKKSTSKISLIVGGHTDTFLYTGTPVPGPDKPSGPYPTVVLNKRGNKILVVQASAYTKYLGNLTVTYDGSGNVVKWYGAPIFLDNSKKTDPIIDEELEHWKEAVNVVGKRIVGNTLVIMPNKPCRSQECLLGNFATDAMVTYYLKQVLNNKVRRDPVIALIHAGGMRAGIEQGNITFNELVSTFPFEDMIDCFDIQGLHLKNIFESHVDDNHLQSPHLFQISGLRVVFNITHPQGQRVQLLQILRRDYNNTIFENVDPEQYYKILLPTFLSTSNFNNLFRMYLKNKKAGIQDLEIYMKYLQTNWPLDQKIEGRIRIVK